MVRPRRLNAAIEKSDFEDVLNEANKYYQQVGIKFNLSGFSKVANGNTEVDTTDQLEDMHEYDDYGDKGAQVNGVEIYCIWEKLWGDWAGVHIDYGTSIQGLTIECRTNDCPHGNLKSKSTIALILAHELGHACGLDDIYVSEGGEEVPDKKVKQGWLNEDWSGGSTRTGYYSSDLKQAALVERLLMFGRGSDTPSVDISIDEVYGVNKDGNLKDIKTGIQDMNRSPKHWNP